MPEVWSHVIPVPGVGVGVAVGKDVGTEVGVVVTIVAGVGFVVGEEIGIGVWLGFAVGVVVDVEFEKRRDTVGPKTVKATMQNNNIKTTIAINLVGVCSFLF